jgi:single-strand DNA-binding protein
MLNEANIIGNLGRDPETRSFDNGDTVTNLSVATNEKWTDKNSGEKKEKTEWHRVTLWGPLSDIASRYLTKGSKVFIRGKIETRKWTDNAGVEKYTTEIVCRGYGGVLKMLDGRRDNSGGGGNQNQGGGGADDLGDEIPFN